ncbi:MAG: hypothetical protein UV61_C0005G0041 [Candidatus Gottesmanbacteria bacterium GW2011_GWB1_43_11]|uniref:Uncharacterized protein n=1 Tax=Candidatus Gottesmanbacteria bacterium GW2011_GWB1_43_11 TaxID=1618446 RepID=A0A0G1CMN3_9BACT|nr:MAG: hypothetical protein UV04_C0010G0041 [Candidatus Gottesmanbacteria bacterium GW2011_GWA2_42_16]KKS55932.1 MAG: hypothetical protein UV17_C0005G0041 [Candidatus Gottesmanbacteria bacterium GW2011_GWA1_42_26]KKS81744.1 MAG: hypothetical protein UV55_C0009G0020 [Candidatus Gottesmanbacteria bacterium GW2011_GWC1_43_10]KKS87020.1 MAG: hypothetical protein UV61_C0005G0041 [Candidatus Gottesmanbacteria bacterium GW2011_GWB1_43_11]OGG07549.1 MAG: hypothetical protein A2699_04790 [Candidatus Go
MTDTSAILNQKSLVVVLAYAPTGLGHLRVTDALYHGLPKSVTPILLGAQDKSISYLHRIMSLHPLGRIVMEWIQQGWPERFFNLLYRRMLWSKKELLYQQIVTILDQRIVLPKTVLFVSTHFGLTHQLAAVKSQIENSKKVKVILIVQVTDDSPQRVWYVPGADLIFVPSERTKIGLMQFAHPAPKPAPKFEVVAYPVSPYLAKTGTDLLEKRKQQLDINSKSAIHVALPISGAAVWLNYYIELIETLAQKSPRFVFHVILKSNPYTQKFINQLLVKKFVKIYTAEHDREIVDQYEQVYLANPIAIEITKPSEQAFKSLLEPTQVGGSLLLFSDPVGRQEYDNLDFLIRHDLLPTTSEQSFLWEKAAHDLDLTDETGQSIKTRAGCWRGVMLPSRPKEAADFIWWAMKQNLFWQTTFCQLKPHSQEVGHAHELGSDGVRIFWEKVAEFIKNIK